MSRDNPFVKVAASDNDTDINTSVDVDSEVKVEGRLDLGLFSGNKKDDYSTVTVSGDHNDQRGVRIDSPDVKICTLY